MRSFVLRVLGFAAFSMRVLAAMMSIFLLSPEVSPTLCRLIPSGVVDQCRARRERKPLSKAVVRERSDPVRCEPQAPRQLARRGLERATNGPDHTHPRDETPQVVAAGSWQEGSKGVTYVSRRCTAAPFFRNAPGVVKRNRLRWSGNAV